jgi:hypothetical protein
MQIRIDTREEITESENVIVPKFPGKKEIYPICTVQVSVIYTPCYVNEPNTSDGRRD